MSALALRFYEVKGEEYVLSARRPPPERLAALEAQIARDLMRAKRHAPGDGWHFLPAPAEVDWNGRYWLGMPRTSEGAVLAAVASLCEAHGLDFMAREP